MKDQETINKNTLKTLNVNGLYTLFYLLLLYYFVFVSNLIQFNVERQTFRI